MHDTQSGHYLFRNTCIFWFANVKACTLCVGNWGIFVLHFLVRKNFLCYYFCGSSRPTKLNTKYSLWVNIGVFNFCGWPAPREHLTSKFPKSQLVLSVGKYLKKWSVREWGVRILVDFFNSSASFLQITNFLHLTPPAIEKHCAALKRELLLVHCKVACVCDCVPIVYTRSLETP